MDIASEAGGHVASALSAASAVAPSAQHLLDRLAVVEARVHTEVERRRSLQAGEPDDRFRGLYVSDLRVDELFEQGPLEPVTFDEETSRWLRDVEERADEAIVDGARLRLRDLARDAGLSPLDVELLLVTLAPDIDQRFEPLYGYLNDDVSLRRATVGLALQLCGASPASARARARLGPVGPLVRGGLVQVEELDRPVLTRSLRVPDRVIAHLLGDDEPDPTVEALLTELIPAPGATADEVARAVQQGNEQLYVVDRRGASAASAAAAGLAATGLQVVAVDLQRLSPEEPVAAPLAAAAREARLRSAGLVLGPIEVLVDRGLSDVRAAVALEGVTILHGTPSWDPAWSSEAPLILAGERIDEGTQAQVWLDALGDRVAGDVDPAHATAHFRLTPEQARRAARSARQQADFQAREVVEADLLRGARSQNAAGLQRLARRIEPAATWDDLILPAEVYGQLRELASRWRLRDVVLDAWRMGNGVARGRGVSALFAGGSGTGKTLASEVIARELGLDLYLVDLSTVVDKYIGETSKNLERIFDEADRVNGVLLFDEADALFGKRSAVSDAKDRHANVEVAYLLQRMETFDGVAILTTNLAANLDEAFMRRLDAIVDFPTPDEDQRRRIWRAKLRPELPQADDVDVQLLADRFKLSGSEIRNVVVSAAYRAAADDRAVTMADLVQATVREHRKIGRHLSSADLDGLRHFVESST